MAEIIGTKGTYDPEKGFYTKRENTTGEIQIYDKNGRIVDSVVDDNKASNRGSNSFKFRQRNLVKPESEESKKAREKFANGLTSAAAAVSPIAEAGMKKPSTDTPMAQHNAQQAALAQNQAAQLKAQQQQANQIAQRNSTTAKAMNEAQKVSEQSALQKQRLAAQQMVGDAGLANAAAARAGAEVDPSQHFSEMQALGSQERGRAVDLGKSAASMASTAESQRALTTSDIDNRQQTAEYNRTQKAMNDAAAVRQAEQDNLNKQLTQSQINKNNAEGQKAGAEGNKVAIENQQTQAATNEKKYADAQKILAAYDGKTPLGEDQKIALYNGYLAGSTFGNGSGSSLINQIVDKFGKNSDLCQWFLETYYKHNGDNKTYQELQGTMSDRRMKAIETPVGHALMGIWKGRTL